MRRRQGCVSGVASAQALYWFLDPRTLKCSPILGIAPPVSVTASTPARLRRSPNAARRARSGDLSVAGGSSPVRSS